MKNSIFFIRLNTSPKFIKINNKHFRLAFVLIAALFAKFTLSKQSRIMGSGHSDSFNTKPVSQNKLTKLKN